MLKKIDAKYERVFKKGCVKEWVSLSAASSYALFLLEDAREINAIYARGYVDLSSSLDSYDLPDADQMKALMDADEIDKCEECLLDIDRYLFNQLKNGSIECRGIIRQNRMVACSNACPPHEYFRGQNKTYSLKTYEAIPKHFWNEGPIIDYRNSSVVIYEDDPEDVNEELEYDKGSTFNIYGMSREDFFVWKEEWIDIEVTVSDLMIATEKNGFDKYCSRIGIDIRDNVKASTGENRFFYSNREGCWIVEYEETVNSLHEYNKDAKIPKTIQYLLKHGGKNYEEVVKKCNWFFLEAGKAFEYEENIKGGYTGKHSIGSNFENDMPVAHLVDLDQGSLQAVDVNNTSNQENIDGRSISDAGKKIIELKKRYEDTTDEATRMKLSKKIDHLNQYLNENTVKKADKQGNIKLKSRTIKQNETDNIKRSVRERLNKFYKKITPLNPGLVKHLKDSIDTKKKGEIGLAYISNKIWITDDI